MVRHMAVAIVATLIKGGVDETIVEFLQGVAPIWLVRKNVIKHTGVPLVARSENDVGQRALLFISVGSHFKVGQSIDDVQW